MQNQKSKIKDKKCCLKVFAFAFFIFGFLSFILAVAPPVQAAEQTDRFVVGSTCFRKEECTSPTYKRLLGPIDPFCTKASPLHSEGAIQRGFNYSCYAAPVPYKLQVPFLTPAFFGSAPNFEEYIAQLYKFLIAIAGILAGIMIIYAGVKWLTSAGNPEKITDATHKVAGACVGLVLVLSSYLLLNTINPDLVRLRLPPVKLIRQVGEVKETKCKNDLKFPCGGKRTEPLYSIQGQAPPQFFAPDDTKNGTYLCDKYPVDNPCSAVEASDCMGVACERGECADIIEDRITPDAKELLRRIQGYNSAITTKRACFSRSFCNGCQILIPVTILAGGDQGSITPEGDRNLHMCASRACECVVSVRKDENDLLWPQCIKRKGTGENCTANAECEEGMQCVPGAAAGVLREIIERVPGVDYIPSPDAVMRNVEGLFDGRDIGSTPAPATEARSLRDPGSHGVCSVPQADGFACHEASDCGSGICGAVITTGYAYICTGGNNKHCGNNRQCAAGLRCIDTWGSGGLCSNGSKGSACRSDYQCSNSPQRRCSVSPSADLPGNQTWLRVGECL